MTRGLRTPILIVGGGTGGVAAALAVARAGARCIVTEPTDWIGGQLTSQAVPPDENRWIEGTDGVPSATATYLEFRKRIRDWYRQHRRLTAAAMSNPRLNPGNGWVSHLCFEPRVGHAVLSDMLAEHVAAGRVTVLTHHEPIAADVERDRIRSITFRDTRDDARTSIDAEWFLDATELGDLYPLTDTEHAIGAEHRSVHDELHGRDDHTDPMDQQAISWCFAVEHRPGEDHTIDRPASYDCWRSYVPELDPPWPGPLLSWTICGTDDSPRVLPMTPWPDEPGDGVWELWRYRRIVDRALYDDPAEHPDVCLVNWVQMDYFRKPLLGVAPAAQSQALEESKEQSRCLLYWMQTEAPRHDSDRLGYPGLKLRGDELGTEDGFAKAAYIREPRRLIARTIVTEGDVGEDQRLAAGIKRDTATGLVPAEPFADSVGIGHYRLDLHPSTAGRNSIYVPTSPFRIPLGALIPVRTANLVAAGKGIGVTHITNGCYRLHPIEWNIGEAAGHLAAYCLENNASTEAIHDSVSRLQAFQAHLRRHGLTLSWPWEPPARQAV